MNSSPYIVKRRQRVGDWICGVCKNLNFSFRNQCKSNEQYPGNRCNKFPHRKSSKQSFRGFRTLVLIHYEEPIESVDELLENQIDPIVKSSLLVLDLDQF
ncbi:unnamed protein product (macronuclear) [Paramecium tetraurelia]|uniref:RanBP2-type domain-containing protein n=1 Tax=Paramecium tetraurelia TaxID=5888 RepID=A0E267_PARTE|nr:uncharacterized protein GSPATT00022556001 [Paramecium tetraurelia]CAK89384.1 unnamed protein product [Paramecium tetraurelia]|eukprot:XP_001456781.1 hypothetical protein (macronuclear) [Paramecium tetraurelia strain d4-2]